MKKRYPILGMNCAACALTVGRTLQKCHGVHTAVVNFADNSATVDYDASLTSDETLAEAVRQAGYELVLPHKADEAEAREEAAYRLLKRKAFVALCAALPLMALSMWAMEREWARIAMFLLSTPVVFWCGKDFFVHALRQLLCLRANMDTLVALSTGTSYLFSVVNLFMPHLVTPHLYFESSVGIIAFILLGRYLEHRARRHTGDALRGLTALQSRQVPLWQPDGSTRLVPIDKVQAGMRIVVLPGARVPVDGTVFEGHSFVDESSLTGEPLPVEKMPQSEVLAGTLNGEGLLHVRCNKAVGETVLDGVIRSVREAQGSRAPVQQTVDRVAAVFVPIVILISLLTFVGWMVFQPSAGLTGAILALTAVLIIACPCALGLATPTALIVGIGRAARCGILIRDAESLQTARRVSRFALDKTGTLTYGKPVVCHSTLTPEDAYLLAYLETFTIHPLASAITTWVAQSQDSSKTSHASHDSEADFPTFDLLELPGQGFQACVDDKDYVVGNRTLMNLYHIELSAEQLQSAELHEEQGHTVVWFANGRRARGYVAITDTLKPTSREAVRTLQQMGVEVTMLTGDTLAAAKAIATEAGISHVHASLLPQDKADYVRQAQQRGEVVAMVGDGINDSAALAAANLSIAMGKGSDVATHTAQATTLSTDLRKCVTLIALSRATMRTVEQNLFWAFIYNIVAIPLAALGFINPMIGSICMALSSISVVTNSLRLRSVRLPLFDASDGASMPQKSDVPTASSNSTTVDNASTTFQPTNTSHHHTMIKTYSIQGMMCAHCVSHVSRALNSLDGVTAVVTLEPAQAVITYAGEPLPLDLLQRTIADQAGDYTIKE